MKTSFPGYRDDFTLAEEKKYFENHFKGSKPIKMTKAIRDEYAAIARNTLRLLKKNRKLVEK